MGVLLLVRHGQASFGAEDYDVLSETGWEQGRVLGAALAAAGPAPEAHVHGALRRHRETWAAMVEGAGWAGLEADVDADWDEFDFLAVLARHPDTPPAGVDRRDFQHHFERAAARWMAGEDDGYPEPYDAFVARSRRALDRAASRPGLTLVVTSGGVIAALAAALVVPPDSSTTSVGALWSRINSVVTNTSVTRVIVGDTGPRLLTFNEHTHLPRELVTYR